MQCSRVNLCIKAQSDSRLEVCSQENRIDFDSLLTQAAKHMLICIHCIVCLTFCACLLTLTLDYLLIYPSAHVRAFAVKRVSSVLWASLLLS